MCKAVQKILPSYITKPLLHFPALGLIVLASDETGAVLEE